jgi:hypothetical protein
VTGATSTAPVRTGRLVDALARLGDAFPLLALWAIAAGLYGWLASRHPSPWLFGDELEYTQLARSIAEGAGPAIRGDPYPFGRTSLYPFIMAPAWLISDVADAYETAKAIGVAFMTAAVFPVYGLARLVVGRTAALLAAAGAVAAPALVYTSFLVQEPVAYFWAALTLWLVVRALAAGTLRAHVLAVAVALAGPLFRGQLVVLLATYVLAAVALQWRNPRFVAWRRTWSRSDWAGALLLAVGIAIVANALVGRVSNEWEVTTRVYKGRMLEYGWWAAGAFAIGVGVLPVVASFAALWRPRGARWSRERVAFAVVLACSLGTIGVYMAAKAAWVSLTLGPIVVERNAIYLVPLAAVATVLLLEERVVAVPGVALGAAVAALAVVRMPYFATGFYFDAPGFSTVGWLNRTFGWSDARTETVLVWMVAASAAVLLLMRAPGALGRGGAWLSRGAAVVCGAWALTGAITGSNEAAAAGERQLQAVPDPPNWVDLATGGRPTLYLAQQVTDANPLWTHEFWNRSIDKVWSMDGTAPGPGGTLTPDVVDEAGHLSHDPRYDYVLVEPGIDLVGEVVKQYGDRWRLLRVPHPLSVGSTITGRMPDGWVGVRQRDATLVRSTYSHYTARGTEAGTLYVTISRKAFCGPSHPGDVTIRLGPLRWNDNRQPEIAHVTAEAGWVVDSCAERTFALPTPPPPFQAVVEIEPFVPAEVDPVNNLSDTRSLGAGVSYVFEPGQ